MLFQSNLEKHREEKQWRIYHLPSEWRSCGGLRTRWSAAGAIFRLNSHVGGRHEGVGNPLEFMEEMHTETLAVPIGTIEPDAQCFGGTGRRTPCKQHPAEVKALLSGSLSAVEISGGTKTQNKGQGWIWSPAGTDFQNNHTWVFGQANKSLLQCGHACNLTLSTAALSALVSARDGCVLKETKKKRIKSYICELSVRLEEKCAKQLIPVVKDLLSLFLSLLLGRASILGIKTSGWQTCTWNQRKALMIWIWYHTGNESRQSFRDVVMVCSPHLVNSITTTPHSAGVCGTWSGFFSVSAMLFLLLECHIMGLTETLV